MLTVHHLRVSQSERIVWLCEELGLEYELKLYDRRADNGMAPDEYKALHPMGIAPVIDDDDLVLAESGAICEYIDGKYGSRALSPAPDDADYAGHLFWFHFANATFLNSTMMMLVLAMADATDSPPSAFITDRKQRAWAMAEARLGQAAFFGGAKLTLADIMMGYSLTTGRRLSDTPIADYPNIRAYLQRLGQREAYLRAMAKAEPGMPLKLD